MIDTNRVEEHTIYVNDFYVKRIFVIFNKIDLDIDDSYEKITSKSIETIVFLSKFTISYIKYRLISSFYAKRTISIFFFITCYFHFTYIAYVISIVCNYFLFKTCYCQNRF